jgi:hypothetical protein
MSFQTADKARGPTYLPTGISPLDKLLDGGLELGLTYLIYGDRTIREKLLRLAVHSQVPSDLKGPVIMIDSMNMLNVQTLTHYSYEDGLEPEDVMDNIFVSRAFNSSQTYELVMNQLDDFIERVPAKLLLLPGLADIYYTEGPMDAEKKQHLTHMAHRIMTFTLKHNMATIITGSSSPKYKRYPAAGQALKHSAQVHVYVEETPQRVIYQLTKHPQHPIREEQEVKPGSDRIMAATLPLSFFIDGLEE